MKPGPWDISAEVRNELTPVSSLVVLATFFHALFDKMRNGENMLSAWVELAPQGSIPTDANLPVVVVLLAEAGKIAFPKPS
jgi:hypothetical protein